MPHPVRPALSSYLEHVMVHLELKDGLTEVPKRVFWPQNGLKHQAGVGGLGKDGERKRAWLSNMLLEHSPGQTSKEKSRPSLTQKPREEMAQEPLSCSCWCRQPCSLTSRGRGHLRQLGHLPVATQNEWETLPTFPPGFSKSQF